MISNDDGIQSEECEEEKDDNDNTPYTPSPSYDIIQDIELNWRHNLGKIPVRDIRNMRRDVTKVENVYEAVGSGGDDKEDIFDTRIKKFVTTSIESPEKIRT